MSKKRMSAESSSSSLPTDMYSETDEKMSVPGGYQSVREGLAQIALGVNPKGKNQAKMLLMGMNILLGAVIILGAIAIDMKVKLDDLNSQMDVLITDTENMQSIMEIELGAMIYNGNPVNHNAYNMCVVMSRLGGMLKSILGVDYTAGGITTNPCCPVGGWCQQLFINTRIAWTQMNGQQ
eukprot:Nk52_evm1s2414 gene=Nk52_evmTU1s2414